jgi:hypothetical protein
MDIGLQTAWHLAGSTLPRSEAAARFISAVILMGTSGVGLWTACDHTAEYRCYGRSHIGLRWRQFARHSTAMTTGGSSIVLTAINVPVLRQRKRQLPSPVPAQACISGRPWHRVSPSGQTSASGEITGCQPPRKRVIRATS